VLAQRSAHSTKTMNGEYGLDPSHARGQHGSRGGRDAACGSWKAAADSLVVVERKIDEVRGLPFPSQTAGLPWCPSLEASREAGRK